MITDTELRLQGITVLAEALGSVEAERFVALIRRALRLHKVATGQMERLVDRRNK